MRLGRSAFFVASATALASAFSCRSFSTSDPLPTGTADGGREGGLPALCPEGPRVVDDPNQRPDDRCGEGGAAVDLATSKDHCGACNHSCQGGVCVEGRCATARVLPGESIAAARVVDRTVYYTTTARFVARGGADATNGEAFTAAFLPSAARVRRLVVAAPWLYVSTTAGTTRLALDDSAREPQIATQTTDANGVVASAAGGYFYAWSGGVEKHDTTGDNVISVFSSGTTNVVSDGDTAYWTTADDAGASLHGPFPETTTLTSVGSLVAIDVDATHLYFGDGAGRLIRRVPRAGGNTESVATEPSPTIGDVAINDTYVYWTAKRGGSDGWVVMRVSKCGGAPLTLARGLAELTTLSFDARYVYVAQVVDPAHGELIRIPK